ncbi:MAG: hypothetical protein HY327_05520 [Chloroflexi bacterium]|nr:hypothetical protein [Chloroflexota bacterium]
MKRFAVATLALAFIVVRALLPNLRLDEISLALFGIICLAILWSDIEKVAAYIRKFRFGLLEFELVEKVERLGEKAEKVEEAESQVSSGQQRRVEGITPDVAERIAEAGTDPRAVLLLVAIEIEEAARRLAREHGISQQASASHQVLELAERGLVSQEVVSLFREFWQVRNQVIHRAGFNIPSGQIYALVDVGLTIRKLLSTQVIKPGGIESAEAFGTPTIVQERTNG